MHTSDPAKILVVDDTAEGRYATARTLRRAGYTVVEAATGADALLEARKGPDLVILDVNVPDISGLEISRILRQDPGTHSLPILQISATFTLREDKILGLNAGADSYLASPLEPEELLAHVRTLLRLKRTQDELQSRVAELEATQQKLAEAHDLLQRQNDLLEERVRERTAKLAETITDLEVFSYSITHDMRAPLRAMHGFAKLLLEEYSSKLEDEGLEYLDRIATSAQRLDLLIRDVLSYSNIVRAELALVPVNTDKLIREVIRDYPELQPPRAEIHLPGPLPPVLGNEAFLTQCFSNLLSNAVKFVAPGVIPRVQVSAQHQNGWVRLGVKDNGIGIPEKHQARIFTLFHRAQNLYPGTGIGLAVVRKAAERMGGRVGFESARGQGSTFWVELKEAETTNSE